MSCIYAALPGAVLQVLSLGSILVSPRTQELDIQIPPFCCNVSENKEERKQKINGMLTKALAEMQDLAVSPKIRDPTLNTVECVIEGHEPNMDATGVSSHIRGILWRSFFSVMLLGPIIAFYALDFLGNDPGKEDQWLCCANVEPNEGEGEEGQRVCCTNFVCCANVTPNGLGDGSLRTCKLCCSSKVVGCHEREDTLIRSANYFCHFLLLIEIFTIIGCLVNSGLKHVPQELFVIPVIIIEGFLICIVQCCTKCNFCDENKNVSIYRRSVFIAFTNVISYHFCWLIVGIMINPAWGMTVLLVVCFAGAALFYSVYEICNAAEGSFIQRCLVFPAAFTGLCLVAVLTVLAGQSFYGKETADDVVKTVILYVVGVISWMFWKAPSTPSTQNKSTQTNRNNSIPTNPDNVNRDEPSSSTSSLQEENGIKLGVIKKDYSGGKPEERNPFVVQR